MRIGFDAYWWEVGPPSGRNVTRNLVRAWHEAFPNDDVVLWTRYADSEAVADAAPWASVLTTSLRPHGLAVRLTLARAMRRAGVSVALTQNFSSGRRVSNIVLVHDALFATNPEWFTIAERIYLAAVLPGAAKAAAVVTTTRNEAQRIASVRPEIEAYPIGLAAPRELLEAEPRAVLHLRAEGFILAVGRLNVRKNLGLVLEALSADPPLLDLPLVVVGESDGRTDSPNGAAGNVRWLGGVDDSTLSWLYSNAAALVFPSLDEGFGLPPIEARAFGCPVAVSDRPVFREVLGDDASYFDPTSVLSMAGAVRDAVARGRSFPSHTLAWSDVVRRVRELVVRLA